MSRAREPLALLVLVCTLAAAACARRPPPPASVVLLTLDTTRRDALGAFGGPAGVTPALDRLARESIAFERAYTVAPLTLPAHASILTGLAPPRHGLRTNGQGRLPEAAVTVAERAREAGFDTGAFVSAVVLAPGFGLEQGFARYDAPLPDPEQASSAYAERPAAVTVQRALDWLERRNRQRPFFLWVHLWDPHAPYEPPAAFRGRTSSPYLDEVAALDDAVDAFLSWMRRDGALDEALLVVVADHGEALGEHGEWSHGAHAFETTLRVPLLVRRPAGTPGGTQDAGERRPEVVGVCDVAPTLVEAMGLAPLAGIDGQSLFAERRSGRAGGAGTYFETYYGYLHYGWSPLVGWVDDEGKFVHAGEQLLFDPLVDPDEAHDLAAERPEALERYRRAIAGLAARPALATEPAPADAGLRDALRALGYADAGAPGEPLPAPLAPSALPAPFERMAEHGLVIEALAHSNEGRHAQAEALYERILADNPANQEALEGLAYSRLRLLRMDEALAAYRAVDATGRATPRALTYLGVCLRAAGREDEALRCYARALEADPNELEALWQAIDLLEQLGRGEEARALRARREALTAPAR